MLPASHIVSENLNVPFILWGMQGAKRRVFSTPLACVAQQRCLDLKESIGPSAVSQFVEILSVTCLAAMKSLVFCIIGDVSIEVCSIILMDCIPKEPHELLIGTSELVEEWAVGM